MASRVLALAFGQTALELALAGITVEDIDDIIEVEKRLDSLLNSDAEVVILDENFRSKFSDVMAAKLTRHSGLPLIIYCPSFIEENSGTDAYINAIVKPAVGFEIRLD